MAIDGVIQPEIIVIDRSLRLRKYNDDCEFALCWYQDEETLLLVDGKNEPYDMDRLYGMYHYLENKGELYFIEMKETDDSDYVPIGDVTFSQDDLPIVIGDKNFRGKGIGTKVLKALITRACQLNFPYLEVSEIYDYNIGSQRLFQGVGFQISEATKRGHNYRLLLDT